MTTQHPNWSAAWVASGKNAEQRAIFSLLALNGLSIDAIAALQPTDIDLENGLLSTYDGQTVLIVSQAKEALSDPSFLDGGWFAHDTIHAFLDEYHLTEHDAHRRLAGAIWYTSEDGRIIRETAGIVDAPILPLRFTFPFSIFSRLEPTMSPSVVDDSLHVLQAAADWLVLESLAPDVTIFQRLIGLLRQGQFIFLISSTGVSGLNLLHNLVMGRMLTPADYGQLTLLITLLLLIGLIPTAMQTITARFSASYVTHQEDGFLVGLYQRTRQLSLGFGLGLFVLLLIFAVPFSNTFQLDDAWLMLPIALTMPFLLMMGVERGILQGLNGYFWLSTSYLAEGIARLGISVVLVLALTNAGRELDGAVWGVAQSVVLAWFMSWLAMRHFTTDAKPSASLDDQQAEWLKLAQGVSMALIGQALITNSDFFLVKNFFDPTESGFYAAISVLGRIAYFGALPITVLIVPLVARQQALGESTWRIFLFLMSAGAAVCGGLLLVATLFAPTIVRLLYGDAYVDAAYLLPTYTIAASLYVLTNLAITYQVALGKGGETWMPLLAGLLQVVGIILFHDDLLQVVGVQIVLMSILLFGVVGRIVTANQRKPNDNDFAIAA